MTPSRQTTCGDCWHYGPIDATEGYCGAKTPEVVAFPAVDEEGKPSSLQVTLRPVVTVDMPGCREFRPLSGGVVVPREPEAAGVAASWKCRTEGCGWPATEPGGLCEGCEEKAEADTDEGDTDGSESPAPGTEP